jgi:hypothetical protein
MTLLFSRQSDLTGNEESSVSVCGCGVLKYLYSEQISPFFTFDSMNIIIVDLRKNIISSEP